MLGWEVIYERWFEKSKKILATVSNVFTWRIVFTD